MDASSTVEDTETKKIYKLWKSTPDEIEKLLIYLSKHEFVEYYENGEKFRLTYNGLHWQLFWIQERWIDLLMLLILFITMIVSIIDLAFS